MEGTLRPDMTARVQKKQNAPKLRVGGAVELPKQFFANRSWDPRAVQALINACWSRGEEPGLLILGSREAKALQNYLDPVSPGDKPVELKGFDYQGLHVVLLSVESCLRVETAETLFSQSRHGLGR